MNKHILLTTDNVWYINWQDTCDNFTHTHTFINAWKEGLELWEHGKSEKNIERHPK